MTSAALQQVPDLAAEWDGTDHFPFRHIERCRKVWIVKINGACHAGGTWHLVALRRHDRCPILPRSACPSSSAASPTRTSPNVSWRRSASPVHGSWCSPLTRFGAAEAERWGLIGAMVPHNELDAATQAIVDTGRVYRGRRHAPS